MNLSCDSVKERLADGETGMELASHLRGCESCSAFAASLDAIDGELETLAPIDAPDALVEATLARAESEHAEAGQTLIVSSPSILVAAFAVLTAALGALLMAPLTLLQWAMGSAREVRRETVARRIVAREAAALQRVERSELAPDHAPRGFVRRMGPTFAVASSLCACLFFMTWQRFGHTVKTKTRGAEMVVNGLPTTSSEGSYRREESGRFWGSSDEATPMAPPPPPAAPSASATVMPSSGELREQLGQLGYGGVGHGGSMGDELAQGMGGRYGIEGPDQPVDTTRQRDTSGSFRTTLAGPEELNGIDDDEGRDGDGRVTLADRAGGTEVDRGLRWRRDAPAEDQQALRGGALRGETGGEGREQLLEGDLELLTATQTATTEDVPRATRRARSRPGYFEQDTTVASDGLEMDARVASARWMDAQRTTGLAFAAHDGWWENTYVPGDAAMRVLHARLAAAGDRRLSGVPFSPLSLAETTSPTVPAVAAPTERAVSLGVHADVASIEGPTRVRMEVAIRGIAQAAGRRGALRIALVIDARDGLDEASQQRIRSIVTALSRSAGSRDRVMLVAAGPHGGTLVELGAMRAGQMEIALRHLFRGDGSSAPASLQAAVEGALEGVASDDGAGLVLLATPDGEHDAALDQALHVGAIAGVVTSAVGITGGVALADLDAIALAGQGRRCLVLSETDATTAVRAELTAAARLVARALRVRVRLAPGVELIDVIGSRALDAEESRRTRETEQAIDQQLAHRLGIGADRDDDQDGIRILLPSFYSGDSHTVMLDLLVTRPGPVADVDVQFKDLVRLGNGSVSSALSLASGTSPRGPHEQRVVASFLAHEVASALETAGDRVALGDWTGARSAIEEARSLLAAARAEVPALATSPSVQADDELLGLYVAALTGGDAALVADSLHYAAHRRLVLPQLATIDP